MKRSTRKRAKKLEAFQRRIAHAPVSYPRIAGSGPYLLVGAQPDAFTDPSKYMLPKGRGNAIGDLILGYCGVSIERYKQMFSRCSLMDQHYPAWKLPRKPMYERAAMLTSLIYAGKWTHVIYMTKHVEVAFTGPPQAVRPPLYVWRPMKTIHNPEPTAVLAASIVYPSKKGNSSFTEEAQAMNLQFWQDLAAR